MNGLKWNFKFTHELQIYKIIELNNEVIMVVKLHVVAFVTIYVCTYDSGIEGSECLFLTNLYTNNTTKSSLKLVRKGSYRVQFGS